MALGTADGGWDCHAIEINLRWGGTTHPSATLRLLTHGHLDEKTGVYRSDRGTEKYYYATDNLKDPRLQGLTPADLALISTENGLDFDHETQKGVIFHLMGTLSMFGKVGATCIAPLVLALTRELLPFAYMMPAQTHNSVIDLHRHS